MVSLDPSLLAHAATAWPGVTVAADAFTAFVAARLDGADPAARCTDDLYLACACLAGDRAALAAFEHRYAPVIERAVGASGATASERADLHQLVRQRLLVAASGEPPRLAGYTGKGALASWIKVVAIREAARLLGRARREVAAEDDELTGLVAAADDPEIGYLKRLYRHEFRAACRAAVEALSDRERVLLRQSALDGIGIDELAALYRVHRATTARWLEAARAAVRDGTRRGLLERLQISAPELDSVMRLIGSRLEASLPALLRKR